MSKVKDDFMQQLKEMKMSLQKQFSDSKKSPNQEIYRASMLEAGIVFFCFFSIG